MSAAFLDYDNDGLPRHLRRQHVERRRPARHVARPRSCPTRPPEVRALYRRHVRGNSLFRNLGRRPLRGQDARGARRDGPLGVVVGRPRLRQRRLGGPLRRQRHADTRKRPRHADGDLEGFFWRQVVARSPLTRVTGHAVRRRLAGDQPAADHELDRQPAAQRVPPERRPGRIRRGLGRGRASTSIRTADRSPCSTSTATAIRTSCVMAARQAPQLRVFRNDFEAASASLAVRLRGTDEQPRRDRRARQRRDRPDCAGPSIVQAGSGFLSQHSKELLFGLGASERVLKLTVDWPSGGTQVFTDVPLNTRIRIVEGGDMATEALKPRPTGHTTLAAPASAVPPQATWLYEPFPAPDFSLPDGAGVMRSLAALRGSRRSSFSGRPMSSPHALRSRRSSVAHRRSCVPAWDPSPLLSTRRRIRRRLVAHLHERRRWSVPLVR